VLELALAQCAAWDAEGVEVEIAVNVGVRNLLDPHFPAEVAELLERHGLPPSRLQLEITESDLMRDPPRVSRVLERLSETGVRLSIDDFGTGYSSLAHLRALPIDEIKIDRSFVMRMDASETDHAIVRVTIELGRSLGLEVVAEGVETDEARHELCALGCHRLQGYLLSPPLAPDLLAKRVRREPASVA
jgi:EAL domain-containing protein (putative c-di-GMP-specific phosphodiesterase class I)